MIDGKTKLIAHIGYPTGSFKSSMIYNPYFEARKINAAVIPMGCRSEDYASFLKLVFRLTNVHGALITMRLLVPRFHFSDTSGMMSP